MTVPIPICGPVYYFSFDLKSDEFEQSFTVEEVKESLRNIGEKFLKWTIDGVQSERREKVEEMASSLREMSNFLIKKKKRITLSKSGQQVRNSALSELEAISPLLDSANDLSSAAKNYLDEIEKREKEKPLEKTENTPHHSSLVDMFRDETPEIAEGSSGSQKDAVTEEHTLDITASLKATPSRSILKTTFSEISHKKITFAKKATKVYEDNEISQISLAKSSGSLKSTKENVGKAPNPPLTLEEGNPRDASQDIFDDTESIINTSLQEDAAKSVQLFKAKDLLEFTHDNSKNEDSKGTTSQTNVGGKADSPQRSAEVKQDPSYLLKDTQTDQMLPFHNFRLNLQHDSSGSENSLDARVNMAINLVNVKQTESDLVRQSLTNKIETPKTPTGSIIPSSVTRTDFRWMEPMKHNIETDPPLQEIIRPTKLPETMLEESFSQKHLLPPVDIQNGDEVKIMLKNPFLANQNEKTTGRRQEPPPQPPVFPPKPTWANPFQSGSHFTSSRQAAQTNTVESQSTSIKDKMRRLALDNTAGQPTSEKPQESITLKKGGMPNEENIDAPKRPTQPSKGSKLPETANDSAKPQSRSHKKRGTPDVSKRMKGAQKADTTERLRETCDSHPFCKTAKYATRLALKQVLQNTVDQAAKKLDATDGREKQYPVEAPTKQCYQVSKNTEENIKISRLRYFGKLWSDPSSPSLPDTRINRNPFQSKLKSLDADTTGRPGCVVGKRMASTKNELKRRLRPRTSSAQKSEEEVRASSKDKKETISNKQTNRKCTHNPRNAIAKFKATPSSKPLPDNILVNKMLVKKKTGSESPRPMNTSTTICKTSFGGEKSSQGRRKQAFPNQTKRLNQKKTGLSQNSQKKATQKPQAKSESASASCSEELKAEPRKENHTSQKNVLETISGLAFPSNNFRPPSGNAILRKKEHNVIPLARSCQAAEEVANQAGPSLLALEGDSQHAQKSSSNPDYHEVQSLKKTSEHEEPGFLKFNQLMASRKSENGGASSFKSQSEKTFAETFHQASNLGDFNQSISSDWKFNLPQTSQIKLTIQTWQGENCPAVGAGLQTGDLNFNWAPFASINAGIGGKTPGAEMEKHQEPDIFITTIPDTAREGVGCQSKKRAGQANTQLPKSPKMTKLQENEATDTMVMQGTEVLYEEQEALSWNSDDFNTQIIDSQSFDTQRITETFDSQNFLLSQPEKMRAHANLETTQSEPDIHGTPYSVFKRGVIENSTELDGNPRTVEAKSHEPEKKKTEAEEIEELINSIEWIQRIPESELIQADNIEELINENTFIW